MSVALDTAVGCCVPLKRLTVCLISLPQSHVANTLQLVRTLPVTCTHAIPRASRGVVGCPLVEYAGPSTACTAEHDNRYNTCPEEGRKSSSSKTLSLYN
jgi:DNA mismatch repair protein MutH